MHFLDCSITSIQFNHNWSSKHPNKVFLDFLESLRNYLQLCYCHPELIQQLSRSNIILFQIYINMDRNLTWTSKTCSRSSSSLNTMFLNILESMRKVLQPFSFHQGMIQDLTKWKGTTFQICTAIKQHLTVSR